MSTADLGQNAEALPARPRAVRLASKPKAPASGIAVHAMLVALAYVIVTGSLLMGLLLQLREEAVSAARRELGAFAQLTAMHTYEVAFALEQKLKFAELTLSVAAPSSGTDQASIGPMLRELTRNSRELKDVLVLDKVGRVVNQANGTADIGVDWSGQPFFARFRGNAGLTFDFGAPLRNQTAAFGGNWFIPVTLAWRKPGGEFMGVIVGLMDPAVFARAWTFDSAIAGLSIALTTADGTVIVRQPFVETILGHRPSDDEAVSELARRRAADTLVAPGLLSGESELQAYRRLAAYPDLLVFVAQPMDIITVGWRRIAWISASCWVLASLALGGLGAWLAREMKARGALERRYHALFNSIPQAVIVSDRLTGRVLAYNDTAEEQYGWPRTQPAPLLSEDFAVLNSQEFSREITTLIPGQRHRNAQGAPIDVELTVRQVDIDGRPGLLTVAADVSERVREEMARKSAEEQLRQSQKMDALGQLTSGIAHDFNNVLMVVMDGAEELSEHDLPDGVRKTIERIAHAAGRAEELTRRMLAFSQKQPLRPRTVNVNDLVVDIGKLLRRTLGENIEIDSVLADEVWPVEIDPAQFEGALVNLCLNARDAMPKGGRVVVETSNVTLGHTDVARMPGMAPGEFVQIEIRDTGHGILPQHLDRIFEPYFTTKASGRASGLGLSMIYGFVKQSSGHIEVQSVLDRGTTFRIFLPRCVRQLEAASSPDTAVVGGNERILVVEDDPNVRASVVRQLKSLGYRVAEAADGTAGLAAVEAAPETFDLLLTDVVMPGPINGRALADEVARRWPQKRMVFMSGYSGNVLGEGSDHFLLLSKPFRKSDLARIVRRGLSGARA